MRQLDSQRRPLQTEQQRHEGRVEVQGLTADCCVSLGLTLAGPRSLPSWHSDENLGGSVCAKHALRYSPDSSAGKESA